MPFALIIIGLVMIVTSANNTHGAMASQLKGDTTGFVKWSIAIGGIGALGYMRDLEGLSRAFLALILISMILSNRGVIARFKDAIDKGPLGTAPAAPSPGTSTAPAAPKTASPADTFSTWLGKAIGWPSWMPSLPLN